MSKYKAQPFQFNYCTIKSNIQPPVASFVNLFQFNYCTIKSHFPWKMYSELLNFNSTIVRLKDHSGSVSPNTLRFQFNYCTIKS